MSTAIENEFKFQIEQRVDIPSIIQELEDYLVSHYVDYKMKTRQSVDTYFDSKDLELFHSGCTMRSKVSSTGKIKLTAKKPVSNDFGMMSREETEIISDGKYKTLKKFCEECFPGVEFQKKPVLTLESERFAFYYKDGSDVLLSLDTCTYKSGKKSKNFVEIELESMSDSTVRDFDSIGIVSFISDELGFENVTKSKYHRGIEWLLSENVQI